ncbi:MAG: hypothetical protein H7A51_14635 [Akkermansiaceae bacterium]|nr:hypothetical protein [Akkermansiaceae bacterium]
MPALPVSAQTQSGFWGKLTWDTVIAGEGETRFRYGNWYGPGWWGGSELSNRAGMLPPVDALDAVAQKHDFAYEIAEKLGRGNKQLEAHYKALADVIAVKDTLALPSDPTKWKPPAKDPVMAAKYWERIAKGFPNYQQRLNELKSLIPSRVDPSHPETLDWFIDGKPPLNEKQLSELVNARLKAWNAQYAKIKARKDRMKYDFIPDRSDDPSEKGPVGTRGKGKQFAWILKRVVDDDGKQKSEQANSKSKVWRTEVNYSRGSATVKMIYLGATNKHAKPPHIQGASIAMTMQWSAPPKIIYAEKKVSLSVSVALAGRSHQWPDMYGNVFTQIVAIGKDGKTPGGELGRFYNDIEGKPRKYWFQTSAANDYKALHETTYSQLRIGTKQGSLIGIRTTATNGGNGKVSTLYIYEWADEKTARDGAKK